MEKLSFFRDLLRDWVNWDARQKNAFIVGLMLILAAGVIIFYERKCTRLENEKIQLKNEHAAIIASITTRNDILLSASEERTRMCNENFLKYLERNETEVRDILFKYEEYKNKKVK